MKKFIVFILAICLSMVFAFSADTIQCSFESSTTCSGSASKLFGVPAPTLGFVDGSGEILSSNVAVDDSYEYSLCCKSSQGSIAFSTVDASSSCPVGQKDLMYFTGQTNARVSTMYNPSFHSDKLCVGLSSEFSMMDVEINESSVYADLGYVCLYRTNALENGLVSSCDAKYGSDDKYKYTVWVKLVESLDSLKCNNDCTSKLDGRVYSACGVKISECSAVPSACDGSLPGSWVRYNSTHEVRCEAPWNSFRQTTLGEKLVIESLDGNCENLIIKKFPVILNNQLVNLNYVMCGEN